MSIPKLTKDLAVIQKLSDLPNATDGLTADQLKAKFDEAGLTIQKWINETFIPSLVAGNIPFTGSTELDADNLQEAVEQVHGQLRDAATGAIVNGSVTAEKLSSELLARIFGGRPWVSLDRPGSRDNPDSEFPIGQIWLRPAFTVDNLAGSSWTATGCTVTAEMDKLTVTGSRTVATATIRQVRAGIGEAGDRVYVFFRIGEQDPEITNLSVTINGGETQTAAGGVFAAELLENGSLTVQLSAAWPSTSLASGSFTVLDYAVVNVDQILRTTAGAKDMTDWAGWLQGILPLHSYHSPRELFIQVTSGVWQQFDHEIFPVERGGTGMDTVSVGELLVGGAGNTLERLPAPKESGLLLQFVDGAPVWSGIETVVHTLGSLRLTSGTYTGSGEPRNLVLPLAPKVLFLSGVAGVTGSSLVPVSGKMCIFLLDGCRASGVDVVSGTYYTPNVRLSGDTLIFDNNTNDPAYTKAPYFNGAGVTYQWYAIY